MLGLKFQFLKYMAQAFLIFLCHSKRCWVSSLLQKASLHSLLNSSKMSTHLGLSQDAPSWLWNAVFLLLKSLSSKRKKNLSRMFYHALAYATPLSGNPFLFISAGFGYFVESCMDEGHILHSPSRWSPSRFCDLNYLNPQHQTLLLFTSRLNLQMTGLCVMGRSRTDQK